MRNKKRFFTIIDNKDIISKFKSRGSYRIFVGTIYDDLCGNRIIIEVCHRSSGKECFEILFTPFSDQDSYGGFLEDFCDILIKVLHKANKVTRRWFLKEARNLRFFESNLGDFLLPGSLSLDWKKIEEDYKKRMNYGNI